MNIVREINDLFRSKKIKLKLKKDEDYIVFIHDGRSGFNVVEYRSDGTSIRHEVIEGDPFEVDHEFACLKREYEERGWWEHYGLAEGSEELVLM